MWADKGTEGRLQRIGKFRFQTLTARQRQQQPWTELLEPRTARDTERGRPEYVWFVIILNRLHNWNSHHSAGDYLLHYEAVDACKGEESV